MYKVTIKESENGTIISSELFQNSDHAQSWSNEQQQITGHYYLIEDMTSEYNDKLNKQQKISEGAKARQACQSVLDLVAGYNLDNDLTAEQITSMQATFATIFQLLIANRPSSAKSLINAIDPDGTIVTAQMKQDCLDLLANY